VNVLVTGVAGYIGSHVAKGLSRYGHRPIVLDSLVRGSAATVKWGPLIVADLADGPQLVGFIRRYRIDAVIHMAGFAYVAESMIAPELYFRNNVANTLNLLEAMAKAGVRMLVFSSTCSTFGASDTAQLSETSAQRPVSPYGESKLCAERMLPWFEHANGLRWVALRYFNAAGADPDGETGEFHEPEPHLVPRAIAAATDHDSILEVFGKVFSTSDGSAVRDFVHVSDLADAHVKALQYLNNGGMCRPFNLGSGTGRSVFEVLEAVKRISGRKVPYSIRPARPGDPACLIANSQSAFDELDWQPQRSTLDCIVETALAWHLSTEKRACVNRLRTCLGAHP
jgi:UDP-arabinose 4-epimerase